MDANRADKVAELFTVDGPYFREATSEAARALAALVRYLNYATAAPTGVPDFGPLYDVLGSVRGALEGIDQTLRQVADRAIRLADQPAARQSLTGDDRWPTKATPRDTADAAWIALHAALGPLAQAADAVRDAQVYVGRLSLDDTHRREFPVDPEDCEHGRWNPDNRQCLDCGHISPEDLPPR